MHNQLCKKIYSS